MDILLYAGSFDPVTEGHLDIIRRASALCGTLVVAVMTNPEKHCALNIQTRMDLLCRACRGLKNVRVIHHEGLLVDCAREQGAAAVVRGVRPLGDFESEYQMARINRMLSGVETLMLTASDGCADISSSAVRQIASFGGDISRLVPDGMADEIRAALSPRVSEGIRYGRQ